MSETQTETPQAESSELNSVLEKGMGVIRERVDQKVAERETEAKRWEAVDQQLRNLVKNEDLLSILTESGQPATLFEDENGKPLLSLDGAGNISVHYREGWKKGVDTYSLRQASEFESSGETWARHFVKDGELFLRTATTKTLGGPQALLFIYDKYRFGRQEVTAPRIIETATKSVGEIVANLERGTEQA